MSQQQATDSPVILIVDDDRTMRALLNLAMEEEGYRVLEAENGEQCLTEFNHFRPDLILLDAVMPDIDGFICCQKIRRLPGGDRLPILLITVLDDQKSIEQAFQAGATDYITKPISWSLLAHRVQRLLDSNRAWTKLTYLENQLQQEQNWSQLLTKLIKYCEVRDSTSQLREVLELIRRWCQSPRVCLQGDFFGCLESVQKGYPLIQDILPPDCNLLPEYGEQYHQETSLIIEDLSQANLSPETIRYLRQLNTQSLSIMPLKKETKLLGVLTIHFAKIFPRDRLSPDRLLDLANLLTILITD